MAHQNGLVAAWEQLSQRLPHLRDEFEEAVDTYDMVRLRPRAPLLGAVCRTGGGGAQSARRAVVPPPSLPPPPPACPVPPQGLDGCVPEPPYNVWYVANCKHCQTYV